MIIIIMRCDARTLRVKSDRFEPCSFGVKYECIAIPSNGMLDGTLILSADSVIHTTSMSHGR